MTNTFAMHGPQYDLQGILDTLREQAEHTGFDPESAYTHAYRQAMDAYEAWEDYYSGMRAALRLAKDADAADENTTNGWMGMALANYGFMTRQEHTLRMYERAQV